MISSSCRLRTILDGIVGFDSVTDRSLIVLLCLEAFETRPSPRFVLSNDADV